MSDSVSLLLSCGLTAVHHVQPGASANIAESVSLWLSHNFSPAKFDDKSHAALSAAWDPSDVMMLIAACLGQQPHPLQAMDPAETDLVLTVPISELIDPKNRLRVGFDAWSGPAFHVDGFVVWGFTAGVLNHVLDVAGWSEPWQDNKIYDLRETLARSRNQESFGVNGRLR